MRLSVIVALKAEARPLVTRLRLRSRGQPGVYCDGRGDITLSVCGVGRRNAARAVERLHETGDRHPSAWLNVGVAGHGDETPGTALIVRKVLERSTGLRVYPAGPLPPAPSATTALCTVDEPETAYDVGWAYDMEGSGFMRAALRIGAAGPVHCLKVVSDGPDHSWVGLSAAVATELIESQLESIESVIDSMRAVAITVSEDLRERGR